MTSDQNSIISATPAHKQDERLYQIALTMVSGIGDVLIKQLISYCGSAPAIFNCGKAKLLKVPGIGEKTADSILSSNTLEKAQVELELMEKTGARVLFFTDKEYPERLKQIPDSPVLLYFKGNIDLNYQKVISIVGTRNSTEYGHQFIHNFISELRSLNPLIVSGLAYGIDYQVHKACLELGVPTVGVMGTGINLIYPAAHKNTAVHMMKNGGLLTELKYDTKPDRQNFPARNRIVAGMADATIIVEAAKGGGALITAEIANSYNKDVFAVPGNIFNKYSEGCNQLIRDNKATLITSATDFIQSMMWDKDNQSVSSSIHRLLPDLSPEETKVYQLLKEIGELQIDDIAWKSQLPINKVASLLLNMEFQGLVKALPGKKFKLK